MLVSRTDRRPPFGKALAGFGLPQPARPGHAGPFKALRGRIGRAAAVARVGRPPAGRCS